MSFPQHYQDSSVEIYPYNYPHTSFPRHYKQESSPTQGTVPLGDGVFVSEIELCPEGMPSLYGAETMGVFLNLPEVLNLSSSSCSNLESVSDITSKPNTESYKIATETACDDELYSNTVVEIRKTEIFKKLPKVLKKDENRKSERNTNKTGTQPVTRKRGRPRKHPVSTHTITPVITTPDKANETIDTPVSVKKKTENSKQLCTQCNTWLSDKSALRRHIRLKHQAQSAASFSIKGRNSFPDTIDKIQNSWISVCRDGSNTFSMVHLHRIKLEETNSFIYPNRTTPSLLYFTDPVRAGVNGCMASSNKQLLYLFDSKDQYKVSELQCLRIGCYPISLASHQYFDTSALYRVSINSQELSGWFLCTEISANSLCVHVATEQSSYARIEHDNKSVAKVFSSSSPEYLVRKIEKMYCIWRCENMHIKSHFKADSIYKVTMASKTNRICYFSQRVSNLMISISISNKNGSGDISSLEKNRIVHKHTLVPAALASLHVSKLESLYSHWTSVSANERFSNTFLYRVNVKDTDGESKYVLITTISPLELTLAPVLHNYLPSPQQRIVTEVKLSHPSCINSLSTRIEQLGLLWNMVDLADKRQEFSFSKIYRVLPFNHTSLFPSRSILCTVVSSDTLHFPDPYNKLNTGAVSLSSKNIYESVARGSATPSLSVSYPLTAIHEFSSCWSTIQQHYQTQFDTGYLYMAQIDVHGHLYSLLSLYVTPDLLLFDAPNEILSIGKLYCNNKSHLLYTDISKLLTKDRHTVYTVLSLRYLTGALEA